MATLILNPNLIESWRWDYSTWIDVTNETSTSVYNHLSKSRNRTPQFRIPANSLSGLDITSVKLKLYKLGGMYSSSNKLYLYATNTSRYSTTYTGTDYGYYAQAVTGYIEFDITTLFNNISNKDSIWYILLTIRDIADIGEVMVFSSNGSSSLGVPYVEITYTPPVTDCIAPTTVDVDLATPPPSYPIEISWDAGTAGTNNPITGYSITRSTTVGGTYTEIDTTIPEVRTYDDTSPISGSYFYKIITLGTEEGYNSDPSTDYAQTTSTTTTDCVVSTTVTANPETPEPSASSLIEWDAGSNGTNNTLTGYALYRDTSVGGSFATLIAEVNSSTLEYSVVAPPTDGNSYYYRVKSIGTYTGYDSDLSTDYATVTATQSAAACTAPQTISISEEQPEPEDLVDITFSDAANGDGNAITGYKLYSDTSEFGSFTTLVDSLTTSNTYGVFEDITASSSYNITTYYRIKTIGTLSGYDSGLSEEVHTLTSLDADYTISLPVEATLPVGIEYIVVYYDSTNVYAVSDDSVIDTVATGTIFPASGVYNDVGTSTYIFYVTNYSVAAYVKAEDARQLTSTEQDYYITYGTTQTDSVIKQWTGTDWTTEVSSNVGAWSQAASSEINQTAQEISFKVSRGAIISEINQTAEAIKIQAGKISLEGLVTANSYFKILEDGSMEASAGTFAGNLTAETTYCNNLLLNSGKEMTVGLWKIGSTGMYYPSGLGYNYLGFLYTGSQAYVSSHVPMNLGPDLGNPLYITASTINFSTTYATYSADIGPDESASGYSDITFNPSEDQAGNIGTPTRLWDTMSCRVLYYVSGGQASSIKLKKNVKNYTEDTGKIIDSLQVKKFKYNKKKEDKEHIGLIWEDTVDVAPHLCYQHKEGQDESKCIDYNELSVILLKEIQNLRKRVKELETVNKKYETRLTKLEKMINK
jgi:hypothetical protein